MLILWIRKARKSEPDRPDSQESFQIHNEDMKNFRLSHMDITAPRPGDITTPDGNILAAVQSVKLARNTQN